MENKLSAQTQSKTDYYILIRKNLKKRYAALEKNEITTLAREVIFAPTNYIAELNETPIAISSIRENLADSLANKTQAQPITSSLETDLADMIEQNNCETSSMNEYYRWISETTEILQISNDNDNSPNNHETFASIQENFINMSYDREAEILLCLFLYQSAKGTHNDSKIELLKFKLARLREMRSIVRNAYQYKSRKKEILQNLQKQCEQCRILIKENPNFCSDFNQILKININDINDEDLEDDFSYINFVQNEILYMMRNNDKSTTEKQHSENSEERDSQKTISLNLSSVRETEGR